MLGIGNQKERLYQSHILMKVLVEKMMKVEIIFPLAKKKVLTVKGHTLMQVLLNKKQGYFMYNDENTLEINRRMIIRFHK